MDNKEIEEVKVNEQEVKVDETVINKIKQESLDEYSSMITTNTAGSWVRTALMIGTLILLVLLARTMMKTKAVGNEHIETERITVEFNTGEDE